MFFSIFLTLLAITLCYRSLASSVVRLSMALLLAIQLFMLGFYVVADYLSGDGIDESVIYHLQTDMAGAGLAEFSGLIVLCTLYLISILAFSSLAYRFCLAKNPGRLAIRRGSSGMLCLLIAFGINPSWLDLSRLYLPSLLQASATPPPEHLTIEQLDPLSTRPNLVVVYLESLERTYFDETIFPGLTPELKALERQALSFTDIYQVSGTGWTIAGMTASQCGIPLVTPGGGNAMGGVDRFLPHATCLGDLLSAQGYQLHYLGGASLSFAGKGRFYETHGFSVIEGLDELRHELDDDRYLSSWGLYDDTLYRIARQRLLQLGTSAEPFGLFMLTLDTHHPNGHRSRSCEDLIYADGSNPMLNAVHCADKMAGQFIREFLASDLAEDTVLVVASDHLAMQNSASSLLNQGTRRNTLMIFAPDVQPRKFDTPGSMLDVAPTILTLLGAGNEGMGLGRSLYADTPTLLSSHETLNRLIMDNRPFFKSLWGFPSLAQGLGVQLNDRQLLLSGRKIAFPALILLDDKTSINEIRFGSIADKPLTQQVQELKAEQAFIWVDHCGAQAVEHSLSEFCLAYGALGWPEKLERHQLESDFHLPYQAFSKAFKQSGSSDDHFQQRLLRLEATSEPGDSIQETPPEQLKLAAGTFLLRSTGGFSGPSFVENKSTGDRLELLRGLTLIGLSTETAPQNLLHVDSCVWTENGSAAVQTPSFNDAMTQASFEAYAVIAHDSAICGNTDLAPLFAGTPLSEWKGLDFRTSYIGIIGQSGRVAEYLGPRESSTTLLTSEPVK